MNGGAGGRVRLAALSAAAVLAAAGAVAWKHHHDHAGGSLPQPAGPVYSARVAILSPRPGVDPCGIELRADTAGIRHAQLPCGVKLYLSYGGTTVLSEVVDQGPTGRDDFELTPALARLLGVHGRATVEWSFAR